MSSGLSRLWKLLFWPQWRDPGRTEALSAHNMTVELNTISRGDNTLIIRVDIGFGQELWLVGQTAVRLAMDGLGIEGGKLIVNNGRKVTDIDLFRGRNISVTQVTVRI